MINDSGPVLDARKLLLNIGLLMSVLFALLFVVSGGKTPSVLYCAGLSNTILITYFVLRNRALNVDTDSAYGRYSLAKENAEDWKLRAVDAHVAWQVMESPSLLVPLYVLWRSGVHNVPLIGLIAVTLFIAHYALRTYVMGVLTKGGKPMPLSIVLQGMTFCAVNGFSQSYYHLNEVSDYGQSRTWLRVLGVFVFFAGMAINHHSDHVLRSLRKDQSDKDYYIPLGGLFQYVSAPNLLGEIVEWWGYAMFAQTSMAIGFAISTTAVIGNRAYGHHQWYKNKFGDKYPKNRRAFFPGLL